MIHLIKDLFRDRDVVNEIQLSKIDAYYDSQMRTVAINGLKGSHAYTLRDQKPTEKFMHADARHARTPCEKNRRLITGLARASFSQSLIHCFIDRKSSITGNYMRDIILVCLRVCAARVARF